MSKAGSKCPMYWYNVLTHEKEWTEGMVSSLMKSFGTNSALLAHHLSWDSKTWTVSSEFEVANDNYHEMMMQDGYTLDDCLIGLDKKDVEVIVEEDSRKQVLKGLGEKDDGLMGSAPSGPSRRTDFSSSTGNRTNRSVNTARLA